MKYAVAMLLGSSTAFSRHRNQDQGLEETVLRGKQLINEIRQAMTELTRATYSTIHLQTMQ